jgi:serine O-acetyltransferase
MNGSGEARIDVPAAVAGGTTNTPVQPEARQRQRVHWLRHLQYRTSPGRLWYYSTKAYQAKLYPLAWLIKALSFFLFKSVLCVECKIEDDIQLVHMGLGCVVHPNVTIGRGVRLFHHVSIAAETKPGSSARVIIEDDVVVGMHAIILGNDDGGIRIGKGAVIGAGAIVNRDVPAGAVVLPMPSRPVKMVKSWE